MAESGIKFFIEAAKRGNEDQLEELLAAGENINQVDSLGNTALHWAASGGHVEAIKVFCDGFVGRKS